VCVLRPKTIMHPTRNRVYTIIIIIIIIVVVRFLFLDRTIANRTQLISVFEWPDKNERTRVYHVQYRTAPDTGRRTSDAVKKGISKQSLSSSRPRTISFCVHNIVRVRVFLSRFLCARNCSSSPRPPV